MVVRHLSDVQLLPGLRLALAAGPVQVVRAVLLRDPVQDEVVGAAQVRLILLLLRNGFCNTTVTAVTSIQIGNVSGKINSNLNFCSKIRALLKKQKLIFNRSEPLLEQRPTAPHQNYQRSAHKPHKTNLVFLRET